MKRYNGLEQDPEGAFVYHDDAQATIAALQAQVKELEAGKSRMILDAIEIGGQFSDLREAVRALKEVLQLIMLKAPGYDWNTDPLSITLMVGNALTKSDHVLAGEPDEENDSLQAQLTQRTAELEAARVDNRTYINERHDNMKQIEQLQADLAERTAELEAAKASQAIDLKNNNEYREQMANLQAELERVRGELVEATHNANVYQSLYSTGCMDRALLENELRDIRTLVLALPKVEGEIVIDRKGNGTEAGRLYAYVSIQTESYYRLYTARFSENEHADSYAALLKHRQGMEG